MSKIQMPEYLPEYKIEKTDLKPFEVKWEELMGWMIVPKADEKLCWGIYNLPSRKVDYVYEIFTGAPAVVHGIKGIEVFSKAYPFSNPNEIEERYFVVQLTDTHSRYLAESHVENGIKYFYTFLDGEDFMDNWGFGEDNCGNETNLTSKGIVTKNEDVISFNGTDCHDVVGRYNVTINGKTYDTVCVVDGNYNQNILSEQFIDKNGKTVLWRRFNKDDWHLDKYKKRWSEQFPDNEKYFVNGEKYVHWYDCITDYIL